MGFLVNYSAKSSFMLIYWELWHTKSYLVSMLGRL